MLRAMNGRAFEVLVRSVPLRGRQFACLWLILALATFAVESGRHSVHHDDDRETATCVFASAAGHLSVVNAPPIVAEPVVALIGVVVTAPGSLAPSARPVGAVPGRAPPPSLSA
jgi:hypothetical protein